MFRVDVRQGLSFLYQSGQQRVQRFLLFISDSYSLSGFRASPVYRRVRVLGAVQIHLFRAGGLADTGVADIRRLVHPPAATGDIPFAQLMAVVVMAQNTPEPAFLVPAEMVFSAPSGEPAVVPVGVSCHDWCPILPNFRRDRAGVPLQLLCDLTETLFVAEPCLYDDSV